MNPTPGTSDAAESRYWDAVYRQGITSRSWYQARPVESLQLLTDAGVPTSASVLDVGGGASTLVDALLRTGYRDVTVLDISADGMRAAQRRLGAHASGAHWVNADLTTWYPRRTYDVWHDRALLHFFTTARQRAEYLRALHAATHPGATAIIGTFASDGPGQCSGRTIAHYDPSDIAALLGERWELLVQRRHRHTTPSGTAQSFAWIAARRRPASP